jgi:hypothetical protein
MYLNENILNILWKHGGNLIIIEHSQEQKHCT